MTTTATSMSGVGGLNGACARTLREVLTRPPMIVCVSVLGVGFLAFFHEFFARQAKFSIERPQDWGHSFLVPLISGYLLWRDRETLMSSRARVFWPGLMPLVLGLVCYPFMLLGIKNHMFAGASMILALFGIVLLLAGPSVMRAAFLPIAYLAFGVTISEQVMIALTTKLQSVAASGGVLTINILGQVYDVFATNTFFAERSGQTMTVVTPAGTQIPLEIAAACAGMRMVVAFAALAGAVALIQCRHWWQRTALLLLAIPVAVFMNVLRVAALGLLSMNNANFAAGDVHMMIGTVILIPGLGLFMLIVWMLNRAVTDEVEKKAARPPVLEAMTWRSMRRPAFVLTSAIMLGAAIGLQAIVSVGGFYMTKKAIQPDTSEGRRGILLQGLPVETLSWKREGSDSVMTKENLEELGTSNQVSRWYVKPAASKEDKPIAVELHGAYYTGMIDTVPHVPERCMVGAGWELKKTWPDVKVPLKMERWRPVKDAPAELAGKVMEAPVLNKWGAVERWVAMPIGAEDLRLRVSEFVGPKGQTLFSGYVFIANGGLSTTAEGVRLLAFNLTDDYAYYMKVQFNSARAASPEELAAQAGMLLDELFPDLMRCVPDWTKVVSGEYPSDNPRRARTSAAAPVK
ncbi:MAG: exosortase/archaeosortase family protein [Phycisphaerales bacterium]|nr:exosortase/archaeosortase family protein [Phycisphaerales bacterium]